MPVHCVVWAKEYLFSQLFGAAEDDAEQLDKAADGENKDEIQELKRESDALRKLREAVGENQFPKDVFEKVFDHDIRRLLSMANMWKNRKPPTPLLYADIAAMARNSDGQEGLRDQQLWSLGRTCDVFLDSVGRLARRYVDGGREPLSFDKDDEDCLDFVCTTANLRAHQYGITRQTRFQVKSIAGNIIPAIATTNGSPFVCGFVNCFANANF